MFNSIQNQSMKKLMFSMMFFGLMFVAAGSASAQTATCAPNDDQVAIFEHGGGDKRVGQCKVLGVGEYPTHATMGLGDNMMSSIKVGKNVIAIVCEQADFKGACEVHDSDDGDLRDNPTVKNDTASSLRVVKASVCSPRTGEKVNIKWTNKTGKAIRVNWINFGCTEEPSDRLIAPGGIFDGYSFTGHVFRVREDAGNKNRGLIYVTPAIGTFDIK